MNRLSYLTNFIILLWISAGVVSCAKSRSPGVLVMRRFGLHINTANGQDYPQAFAEAKGLGMTCAPLTVQWTALESDGRYDTSGLLNSVNDFFSSQNTNLSLCLSPIAANRRDWPQDLAGKSFDDNVVISRFNTLLDTLHKKMSNINLLYLLIGNEIDLYLSLHPEEWPAYTVFCTQVKAHASALWGESLKIGAETTFGARTGNQSAAIDKLNELMDMIAITYYPLRDDFKMGQVDQVANDLQILFERSYPKKIIFQECGYATSQTVNGSEANQQKFVQVMFDVWDTHALQIEFMAFLWLHDLSPDQAHDVAVDYGLAGTQAETNFTEYVRSLGLITWDGRQKPAFGTLRQLTSEREWAK